MVAIGEQLLLAGPPRWTLIPEEDLLGKTDRTKTETICDLLAIVIMDTPRENQYVSQGQLSRDPCRSFVQAKVAETSYGGDRHYNDRYHTK